jgi:hypothetical protein
VSQHLLVHEYVRSLEDPELEDAIIGDDERPGTDDLSDSEIVPPQKAHYEKVFTHSSYLLIFQVLEP